MRIQPGDYVHTWFSDRDDGLSEVQKVLPYTGRYPDMFNCVLVLRAPRTALGWTEMAYNDQPRRDVRKWMLYYDRQESVDLQNREWQHIHHPELFPRQTNVERVTGEVRVAELFERYAA